MMRSWPDGEDLLVLLAQSTGPYTRVRDPGVLVAAAFRPHTVFMQNPCYPGPLDQAAALLHAIMVWEPLELWNSGLAWAALRVFLERSALPLVMPAKDRMELTADITTGVLTGVDDITERLAPFLQSR